MCYYIGKTKRIMVLEKQRKKTLKLRQILEIMFASHVKCVPLLLGNSEQKTEQAKKQSKADRYVVSNEKNVEYTAEQKKEKGIIRIIDSEEFGHYLIVAKNSELITEFVYPEKKKTEVLDEHFEKRKAANWVPSRVAPDLVQKKKAVA